MALLLRHRPLDFHEAVPLTRTVIESTAVDDHHVFPKGYLHDIGLDNRIDTVLNHTLIDRETNIRIQKKAPSVYLAEIAEELPNDLPRILESHGLPPETNGPLWMDDFDAFLEWGSNTCPSSCKRSRGNRSRDFLAMRSQRMRRSRIRRRQPSSYGGPSCET